MNQEAAALIAEHAEEWLERMKHSQDPRDRKEFLAWLQASPVHVREILLASTWDNILTHALDSAHRHDIDALMRQGSNVVPLKNGTAREIPPAAPPVTPRPMLGNRIGRGSLIAVAAAACLMVAIAITMPGPSDSPQQLFGTATGEQRSIVLADGSIIHMNTQSNLRVDFSDTARDVYLLDGQAIFKVKHDPQRPFRVHVDSTVVQAIGTQFDVHRLMDRTNVAVIEGVVQIISGIEGKLNAASLAKLPEQTRVPAGKSVVISGGGKLAPQQPVSPQDASAWQQRRLIFRNNTLAEIAAEFNRYNRVPQIRIVDDKLQAVRLTMVLDADDPESLLEYLSIDHQIAFERTGSELVIRAQNLAQLMPQP